MLSTLSIRDVVLIEKLDIDFSDGLTGLTGETGAGKSILLDSLGLSLGFRAEQRLVRNGAKQASVTASFDVEPNLVREVLTANELDPDLSEGLILRRVLTADGKSRAFVNGEPVTVGVLRALGDRLADIHGQFDNQRLLEPGQHRGLVDLYGDHHDLLKTCQATWATWRAALEAVAEAEKRLAKALEDEAFLRHAVEEIDALDPQPSEEHELAQRRSILMNAEKIAGALADARSALSDPVDVADAVRRASGEVERLRETVGDSVDPLLSSLDRAMNELDEATSEIERLGNATELDPRELETVEERLFAFRALARKHGVEVENLMELRERLSTDLAAIEDGGASLDDLRRQAEDAREAFVAGARALTSARQKAGSAMVKAIMVELPHLKLGDAVFDIALEQLNEDDWSMHGQDRVVFRAAANPGATPGPIAKILSGGELARFMLALKVVVAKADPVPTLVFDEVDSGIGGATAAAVGERLATLGTAAQVLVVTHSPQVAAGADQHLRVAKISGDDVVRTLIDPLDDEARREEIARMISGAEVTDEARAQASNLLAARGSVGRDNAAGAA